VRCIFCKSGSDGCVSVEHIIPESLGNTEHVLSRGWVCDGCNNYLSRKVEKPFLDTIYGRHSRFEMRVPNKDGRVPPAVGLHAQSAAKVELFWSAEDGASIAAAPGENEARWIRSLVSLPVGGKGTLYIPHPEKPEPSYDTSRFIAKVALEVLAYSCLQVPGANDEIVDKAELEELRHYVRRGNPGVIWPVHVRRLYPPHFVFSEGSSPPFQVLHEFGIIRTEGSEFYAVIVIFGLESAINLGGPELGGFERWLARQPTRTEANDGISQRPAG